MGKLRLRETRESGEGSHGVPGDLAKILLPVEVHGASTGDQRVSLG